jgi:hypothetical protein
MQPVSRARRTTRATRIVSSRRGLRGLFAPTDASCSVVDREDPRALTVADAAGAQAEVHPSIDPLVDRIAVTAIADLGRIWVWSTRLIRGTGHRLGAVRVGLAGRTFQFFTVAGKRCTSGRSSGSGAQRSTHTVGGPALFDGASAACPNALDVATPVVDAMRARALGSRGALLTI